MSVLIKIRGIVGKKKHYLLHLIVVTERSHDKHHGEALCMRWQDNKLSAGFSTQLHTHCPSLTFLTFNCHVQGEVMEE